MKTALNKSYSLSNATSHYTTFELVTFKCHLNSLSNSISWTGMSNLDAVTKQTHAHFKCLHYCNLLKPNSAENEMK